MNIIIPTLYILFIPVNISVYLKEQTPKPIYTDSLNAVVVGLGLLQVVSGYILIKSVYSITQFFKQRSGEHSVNSKWLLLHSSAFGLYLLTQIGQLTTLVIYLTNPLNPNLFNIYAAGVFFALCGSFISQISLVFLFWDLGTEENDASETATTSTYSI